MGGGAKPDKKESTEEVTTVGNGAATVVKAGGIANRPRSWLLKGGSGSGVRYRGRASSANSSGPGRTFDVLEPSYSMITPESFKDMGVQAIADSISAYCVAYDTGRGKEFVAYADFIQKFLNWQPDSHCLGRDILEDPQRFQKALEEAFKAAGSPIGKDFSPTLKAYIQTIKDREGC